MAEITNELMYELMKRMHGEMANLRDGQNDLRQDFISLRNHIHVMQGDVNNLQTTMPQVLIRLDGIENGVELRDESEAQARIEADA